MYCNVNTTHLTLYAPTPSDFTILRNLWRNEKVRQFLGGVIANEQIDAKITSIRNHWAQYQFGIFAVADKLTENLIGLCGLHHSKDGIECSYMFFPEWWGKGLAFEAAKASLDYGFHDLKLERIIAITQEANVKSCKMLEKLGMTLVEKVVKFEQWQRVYAIKQKTPRPSSDKLLGERSF